MQSLQQHVLESLKKDIDNSLTYDQAVELGKHNNKVRDHIMSNYVKMSYGYVGNILGKFGRSIPETGWKKIEKLAKEKSDSVLIKLIADFRSVEKSFKK